MIVLQLMHGMHASVRCPHTLVALGQPRDVREYVVSDSMFLKELSPRALGIVPKQAKSNHRMFAAARIFRYRSLSGPCHGQIDKFSMTETCDCNNNM
jgi:hypothetical protein